MDCCESQGERPCRSHGSARDDGVRRAWPTPFIQAFKIQRLAQELPVIVEIVDLRNRLESFLESVGEAIEKGMFILKDADVRFYRAGKK
jgi:hypothetical protein